MGASDIGHRHYGPKARQSGPGNEPRTDKKITLHSKGIEPRGPANHMKHRSHANHENNKSPHVTQLINHRKHNQDIHVEHGHDMTCTFHMECGQQTTNDSFDLGKKIQKSCFIPRVCRTYTTLLTSPSP